MRLGITPKMISVAVALIGYYFWDGCRSRETLRWVRRFLLASPLRK